MRRAVIAMVLCLAGAPAQASEFDEIQKTLFDETGAMLKAEYRRCNFDSACSSVLSMCRWRPVNVQSKESVAVLSARVQLECKWPGPPAEMPEARCVDNLCVIPPDGRFY